MEDCIVRYGGDEFIIVFNENTLTHIDDTLRNIEDKLAGYNHLEYSVGFSFGKSEVGYARDIYHLVKQADSTMYKNKEYNREK